MIAWRNFKDGNWCKEIDVADFIDNNYNLYVGNADFLSAATSRTNRLMDKVNDLLRIERGNKGVLGVDTTKVSSILAFKPGYIDRDIELIVGLQTEAPLVRAVNPFGGIRMAEKACECYGYKLSESVTKAFEYRTTHNDGVFRIYTPEMKKARHVGVITGLPDAYGRGRIIGDYRRLPLYGMDRLIKLKRSDKDRLGRKTLTADNIQLIEDVYRQIEFMVQLKEMALQYGYDISRPAENAREAIQWLYFAYLGTVKEQNGAANSIGRITNFLDIYIDRDITEGNLNEAQAQELIDDFVIKLRLVRHLRTDEYNELFAGDPTWVTVSEAGMSQLGKPMVTKTSFRMLQSLYNLGASSEPNITILWSDNLPQNYKNFCAKVSIDTDSIQYENDDLMRPRYGSDYSIACCVSAMRTGKQMQYFGARCNIAKVLLMAINGGKDEIYGEQIAPKGNIMATDYLNYDDVMKSYNKYSAWVAKLYVNTLNIIHYMHDKYAYERLMMSFHDTEVERLMAFGICGLSVLVDSLSAIKYAKVKPILDDRGIISDFEVTGDYPKFGNDDDRVDDIAKFVVEDFYNKLKRTKAYRKAIHTLSILTITSNVVYGKKTGNTPDGRKRFEPFAPGANPMHGRDIEGAVASLASVAKLDYDCCRDGISNTFTVTPNVLGISENTRVDTLTNLLDGYFNKGAHHLNVNVLNRDKLIDAMNNPDKYPNLTIRVSGYAVNFNKLSRGHQEEVIARTFHEKL